MHSIPLTQWRFYKLKQNLQIARGASSSSNPLPACHSNRTVLAWFAIGPKTRQMVRGRFSVYETRHINESRLFCQCRFTIEDNV